MVIETRPRLKDADERADNEDAILKPSVEWEVLADQTLPASDRRPTLRERFAALPKASQLNLALAGLLVLLCGAELALYGDPVSLAVYAPFIFAAGWLTYALNRNPEATGLMRAAGWLYVFIGGTSALSFVGSLTSAPVDIACAVISSTLTVASVYPAHWLLTRGAR